MLLPHVVVLVVAVADVAVAVVVAAVFHAPGVVDNVV